MIGNLNSVNIVNSGSVISDTITSSGLVTCNNGLTVTGATLNYGTYAASGLIQTLCISSKCFSDWVDTDIYNIFHWNNNTK